MKKALGFLKQATSELKKVRWSNKKEIGKSMVSVTVTTMIVVIIFVLFDTGYSYIQHLLSK